jgi:hypothetical protein
VSRIVRVGIGVAAVRAQPACSIAANAAGADMASLNAVK